MSKIETTVQIRYDEDQYLSHPEEMCIVTHLVRAVVTTYRISEHQVFKITEQWIGVDIPSEARSYHFRKVRCVENGKLFSELEQRAFRAVSDGEYIQTNLPDQPEFDREKETGFEQELREMGVASILTNNQLHKYS